MSTLFIPETVENNCAYSIRVELVKISLASEANSCLDRIISHVDEVLKQELPDFHWRGPQICKNTVSDI